MNDLKGKTAVVTGGSRGFGRGIVKALAAQGMRVVAVARDRDRLDALCREVEGDVVAVSADVTDPMAAAQIIERERPHVLVLNAGAQGLQRPTRFHTWETFSIQFQVDFKSAFIWAREALILPLDKGSTIVLGSSGAALRPFSVNAGYAAAKGAIWTFARSLAQEAGELGLRVHCLLPLMSPETEMGRAGLQDFARRMGVTEEQIVDSKGMKPFLTPAFLGQSLVSILTDADKASTVGFRITGTEVIPLE